MYVYIMCVYMHMYNLACMPRLSLSCCLAMRLVISYDTPRLKNNIFRLPCVINKTFHLDAWPISTITQNTEIFQKKKNYYQL